MAQSSTIGFARPFPTTSYTKIAITPITVEVQEAGTDGQLSCGYHALKLRILLYQVYMCSTDEAASQIDVA
jgi:hypothetical protein